MVKVLHDKVKALQVRAMPAPVSSYLDKNGNPIDLKITINDDNTVQGYLAVFGIADDRNMIAVRGCFAKSLQERGPNSNSKFKIIFLWCHDQADPIGQFTELEEDDYGLRFKAALDVGVPSADRCLIQVRSGTINQFSYGFNYIWDKMQYDERLDAVLMYECALYEGSAVSIGSNQQTYAIRSKEDYEGKVIELQEECDAIIRTLPRKNQLEVRQLLTKHITLYSNKPEIEQLRAVKPTLDLSYKPESEEVITVGNYKLNTKQFLK
jgi:HK97 family phage prohead protease